MRNKIFSVTYRDEDKLEYIIEDLWIKHNVVYDGGVHGFRLIKRKGNPLVQLICEDDRQFFSYENDPLFDCGWLNKLAQVVLKTMEKIEDMNECGESL